MSRVNRAVTGMNVIIGKGFVSGLIYNLCTVTDRTGQFRQQNHVTSY